MRRFACVAVGLATVLTLGVTSPAGASAATKVAAPHLAAAAVAPGGRPSS